MGVILACRLQICLIHWMLQWCMTNVRANVYGSYIGLWITNLPYLLGITLVYGQCKVQSTVSYNINM